MSSKYWGPYNLFLYVWESVQTLKLIVDIVAFQIKK